MQDNVKLHDTDATLYKSQFVFSLLLAQYKYNCTLYWTKISTVCGGMSSLHVDLSLIVPIYCRRRFILNTYVQRPQHRHHALWTTHVIV